MQSLAALNTGDVRLDAPMDPEGDRSLIERFVADEMPDTEEEAMNRFLTDEIEQALGTLPPRDAKVLRLYFGLEGGREHTLEEIGSMLGVTRERVRQLRDRALKRLREGDVGPRAGQLRGLRLDVASEDGRCQNADAEFRDGYGPLPLASRRRCLTLDICILTSAIFGCSFLLASPLRRYLCRMIRLVDVHKAFGPKRVLNGFTLDVNEGETMVIIGYSGTGKVGRDQAHRRPARAGCRHGVRRRPGGARRSPRRELYALRAQIGYVFQFAALFDSLTIGENVAMGLRKQGELTPSEIERPRRRGAASSWTCLTSQDRFPAELSGGMRKRVGIARAIALRPKYILYDEPTTGLDPVTSAVIDQLMIRMRDKLGVTSIVITHDMRSAYTVGTRIAMLYEGRVRQVGTVDEIRHTSDPGRAAVHRGTGDAGRSTRAERDGWRDRELSEERSAGGVVYRMRRRAGRSFSSSATATRTGDSPRGTSSPTSRPSCAALREVQEETGLDDLALRGEIDTIDWYFRFRGRLIHKVCHFYLMESPSAETSPQRAEGITACRWAPMRRRERHASRTRMRAPCSSARRRWWNRGHRPSPGGHARARGGPAAASSPTRRKIARARG